MHVFLICLPLVGLLALFAVLVAAKHCPLDNGPLLLDMKQVPGQVIIFLYTNSWLLGRSE